MIRTLRIVAIVALVIAGRGSFQPAAAEDWMPYGPQGHGMGGAGTANVTGPMAPQWNPANLHHFRAGVDEERDVGISTGAFTDFSMNIIAATLEFDVVGDVIVHADQLYQTIDWVTNSGQYNELGLFLFDPTAPAVANIENELTGAFAAVALFSSLNQRGQGLVFDGSGGMDFQIGQFGIHLGASEWSAAHPFIDYGGLDLSGGTPQELANGIDREFGANSIRFPFLPGTLTLDEGGQKLALDFLNAGVVGNTSTSNYSAAELLAYFYQISAAEAGLLLTGNETRQGIVFITTAPGPGTTFPGGGTDPFANNDSAIRMRGVVMFDISASFGAAVVDDKMFGLQLGVTARVLYARTFFQDVKFSDIEQDAQKVVDFWTGLFTDPFDQNAAEDFKPTFDVGMTLMFFERRLRVAVVGRNLIEPELQFTDGQPFRVPMQFRLGVAFDILENMLTVAADVDLARNTRDTLPGLDSREVAFGIEYKPLAWLGIADQFGLALRTGAVGNLLADGTAWQMTAGIGLRAFVVQLDITGGMAFTSATDAYTTGSRPWADYGNTLGNVPASFSLSVALSVGLTW